MPEPRIKLTVEISNCPTSMMQSLADLGRNAEVLTGAQFAETLDALKKRFMISGWDHQIGPSGSHLAINFKEVF